MYLIKNKAGNTQDKFQHGRQQTRGQFQPILILTPSEHALDDPVRAGPIHLTFAVTPVRMQDQDQSEAIRTFNLKKVKWAI